LRFVMFYDYKQEEATAVVEANNEMSVDRERFPEKWPKQLTPTYNVLGDLPELEERFRGFAIYDAENEEQLQHYMVFLHSKLAELGVTGGLKGFLPLIDGAKTAQEWKDLSK